MQYSFCVHLFNTLFIFSESVTTSDGYRRGYVSFAHFLLYIYELDICQVAQTVQRGGPRSQIAIPAQGLIEFRDALTDLLDEFGTDDHGKCDSYNSTYCHGNQE